VFLITFIILWMLFPVAYLMAVLIVLWARWMARRVQRLVWVATPVDLERNKALNAAWADLMIIDPEFASKWRKRYPERPNSGLRERR
jgi:predicted membrane protein